jgi:hypothetical protein
LYGNEEKKELGVTGVVTDLPGYDALNPLYQIPFHLPLTPQLVDGSATVTLQLMNNTTDVLGEIVITQAELLKATDGTIREKRKIGDKGASLSFQVSLSGVAKQSLSGDSAYASIASTIITSPSSEDGGSLVGSPPISPASASNKEMIRLTIAKGYGFPIRRRGPFKKKDIPDAYCTIKFGSSPSVWRTKTIKDNITPVWTDEYKDYPLASANQIVSIDVYDANKRTKDEYYGNARISVGKVLLNGGSLDVEVLNADNQKTGIFITVLCQKH